MQFLHNHPLWWTVLFFFFNSGIWPWHCTPPMCVRWTKNTATHCTNIHMLHCYTGWLFCFFVVADTAMWHSYKRASLPWSIFWLITNAMSMPHWLTYCVLALCQIVFAAWCHLFISPSLQGTWCHHHTDLLLFLLLSHHRLLTTNPDAKFTLLVALL